MPELKALPLTIAGRSPFDPIRLRWSGIGNLLLGISCFGGGNVAGVLFGIIFVLLAIATWVITSFGQTPWYALSPNARIVAGVGTIIGTVSIYLAFCYLFLLLWFLKTILKMMAE